MSEAIVGKKFIFLDNTMGTGATPDPRDDRDFKYEEVALGAAPVNWDSGYDIEDELDIKIGIKNQNGSSSCVGQAWAYYLAVIEAVEHGIYDDVSAKAFYSQIYLPNGGAYIRDGAKLAVNYGALQELLVSSYDNGKPPTEAFIRRKDWMTDNLEAIAKRLQSKEYRTAGKTMEIIAMAIRDNYGCVGGVNGQNNGTWGGFEPKPPTIVEWGHSIFLGKYGIDSLGKFIATPNSWGNRGTDKLHPDGWQKLREDYFDSKYMFNPWTLTDKPNPSSVSSVTLKIMADNDKKIIMEAEGPGRKGIMINGEMREIFDPTNNRATASCLYALANNGIGTFVDTKTFNEIPKGKEF